MYRMRQREFIARRWPRRRSTLRRALLDLADRHRETRVRRAHAHAAGAADDHRALPARRDRAARTRRRRGCRRPTRRPTGTRSAPAPSPAPAFRSIAHRTSELLGFDGADRQHLRQHRHRRLPARERVGDGGRCSSASAASCRTCCSGARWSSATCGWPTASCSRAASCRRSATRSRSSTRAPSAARRSARRRRS